MSNDRSNRALARIEAALARIEAAAAARAALPPAAENDPTTQADLDLLQARHDRLRAVVQDSLQQLDLLIEGTTA